MSATNRMDNDGISNINNYAKVLFVKEYYKYTHISVDVAINNDELKNLKKPQSSLFKFV